MNAAIVSIGTEILLAHTRDTNFPYIADGLTRAGVRVVWHATVPDHLPAMIATLREARARADVVVTIGGLGPTVDDRTRDAVVAVTGRPLALDAGVLHAIEERFATRKFVMTPSNAVQAMVPRGATVLPNANGTAPGLRIDDADGTLFVFPGPPRELMPLADTHLFPWVATAMGRPPRRFVTFRTVGIAESALAEKLGAAVAPLLAAHDVAYLPHWGLVDVRVAFDDANPEADRADEEAIRAAVRDAAGHAFFGEGETTHEQAIGALLREKTLGVACAESVTGGRIASHLHLPPGASDYFLGGVLAYSDLTKQEVCGVPHDIFRSVGAVSDECARAMAVGGRKRFSADIAVSSTGIAGPTGAVKGKPIGLVFLAVATRTGTACERWEFPGGREEITHRATPMGLELLRKVLGVKALGDAAVRGDRCALGGRRGARRSAARGAVAVARRAVVAGP